MDDRTARWLSQFHRRIAPEVDAWLAEQAFAQHQLDLTADEAVQLPLLEWGQQLLPAHFTLPPSALHRWLGRRLDKITPRRRRGRRLNVIGPRGSAKSTLVTLAYVLRMALEKREPYVWIVSDTRHQAVAHLQNVKTELVDNRLLAHVYPAATGEGPQWRSTAIVLPNDVMIEAFGTGQRIRGRRRGAHRPTLIVCDDIQNDSHIESSRARELSRRWFHGTLLRAGTPRTNTLHLATALHHEALALELAQTPGWRSRTFRAIGQWPERMDLWAQWEQIYADRAQPNARARASQFYRENRADMRRGATLLWPQLEGLYALMCMRAESGHTAFEREKQGSPLNPELCEWPEEYFAEPLWFEIWPTELRVRVIALDPSKGTNDRTGDYSAFVVLGVDHVGLLYVQADLQRRPTPQIVADGVELVRLHRPDALGIESNQFQELLADQFAAELTRQGVVGVRPWTIDNRISKAVRIRRLGPLLAGHRFRFKLHCPGTRLLVEQLRNWPAGDHDDGPDALEMAVRLAGVLLNGSARDDGLGERLIE